MLLKKSRILYDEVKTGDTGGAGGNANVPPPPPTPPTQTNPAQAQAQGDKFDDFGYPIKTEPPPQGTPKQTPGENKPNAEATSKQEPEVKTGYETPPELPKEDPPAPEEKKDPHDPSSKNYHEIRLLLQECGRVLEKKIQGTSSFQFTVKDILILSPYKAQLSAIRQSIPAWIAFNRLQAHQRSEISMTAEACLEAWNTIAEYCTRHYHSASIILQREGKEITLLLSDACKTIQRYRPSTTDYHALFAAIEKIITTRLPLVNSTRLCSDTSIAPCLDGILNQEIESLIQQEITGETIDTTTVDSIQGGQRPVVLLSFVRSNPENRIGFLNNLHRLLVALSRAEQELILIGDFSKTLSCTHYTIPDTITDLDERAYHEDQQYQTEEARRIFEFIQKAIPFYQKYADHPDMPFDELQNALNRLYEEIILQQKTPSASDKTQHESHESNTEDQHSQSHESEKDIICAKAIARAA